MMPNPIKLGPWWSPLQYNTKSITNKSESQSDCTNSFHRDLTLCNCNQSSTPPPPPIELLQFPPLYFHTIYSFFVKRRRLSTLHFISSLLHNRSRQNQGRGVAPASLSLICVALESSVIESVDVNLNMIVSRRYSYSQENRDAIDVHHVQVRRRSAVGAQFLLRLCPLLLLLAFALNIFLLKDISLSILFWSCFNSSFIVILLIRKPVKKESIVILPAFGVQLETHYLSGKVFHRFIPIEKILKPVLLERVTPTACYWSLSLTMRGEEELMLVFKELRPPLKMLVPIWKALSHLH